MTFKKRKLLLISSQQPANQYAGGGTGINDSEQFWMRKLAEEVYDLLKGTGHDVRLGPKGSASDNYNTNVKWVQRAENKDADLLLSFHSNATGKSESQAKGTVGIGAYHHPNSPKGKAFAEALLPHLKPASAGPKVYRSTLTVAELANTTPPAVLVEHEYHDWVGSPTSGGADWIRHAPNRTRIAQAYLAFVTAEWGVDTPPVIPPVDPPVDPPIDETCPCCGQPLPVEPEIPEPPTKKRRAFRLLFINTLAERFQTKGGPGVPDNSDKWPIWLKKQNPSIMLLVETSETRRNAIRKYLGMTKWLTYPLGYVAVMWIAAKWKHLAKKDHKLTTAYHGAMRVTLQDREGSGLEVDVVSIHVRPKASFPSSYTTEQVVQAKLKDLREALATVLRPGVPVWVGGDFNTARHAEVMLELGFTRATPAVDTVTDPGDQKLDAVWCRAGSKVATPIRGQQLLDPGTLSDHKGWLVNATIEEK